MSEKVAKLGTMLLISQGEYSSYQRMGWFMVVQTFSPQAEVAEYMAATGKSANEYASFDPEKFIPQLLKKGLIVEVNEFFDEWFMGDYGKANTVSYMERSPVTVSDE